MFQWKNTIIPKKCWLTNSNYLVTSLKLINQYTLRQLQTCVSQILPDRQWSSLCCWVDWNWHQSPWGISPLPCQTILISGLSRQSGKIWANTVPDDCRWVMRTIIFINYWFQYMILTLNSIMNLIENNRLLFCHFTAVQQNVVLILIFLKQCICIRFDHLSCSLSQDGLMNFLHFTLH